MNKINKTIYMVKSFVFIKLYALFFVITSFTGFSQEIGNNILLDETETGTKDYVAKFEIDMKPGFSYTAAGSDYFSGSIDNNVIYNSDNQSTPLDPNINTDLPVGTISGKYDVTRDGAATYSIPIAVPPGSAGMKPSLSVNYNSLAGNGIMGLGWNLSAVSSIKRIPKNIYYDGVNEEILFDETDKFALNGNRLITVATDEYRTQIESFSRIISHGFQNNGPIYFTVETKDGKTIEYGNTSDSRIEAKGQSGAVLKWLINKITDSKGNYMTFTYYENTINGEYRLSRIDYTGNANASLSTYNHVEFTYESRSDIIKSYISGSLVQISKRLSKIETFCEGVSVKSYEFDYSEDIYSRLINITEYVTDGVTHFNPTNFEWGSRSSNLETSEVSFTYDVVGTGDFNGDGQEDVIVYTDSPLPTWNLEICSADGQTFSKLLDEDIVQDSYDDYSKWRETGFSTADFNGDGMDDIIIRTLDHVDYFLSPTYEYRPETWIRLSVNPKSTTYTGDFTGDGLLDLLVVHFILGTEGDYSRYDLFSTVDENGEFFKVGDEIFLDYIEGYRVTPWIDNGWSKMEHMYLDANGNGKTEILIKDHSRGEYVIYEYIDYENKFEEILNDPFSINVNMELASFGDYNSDGKTDFFIRDAHDQGKGYIVYSTGTDFVTESCSVFDGFSWVLDPFNPPNKWLDPTKNKFYSQDMNGDGLVDLVAIGLGLNAVGTTDIYVALNQNGVFASYTKYEGNPISKDPMEAYFGDFDGDGNPDYLCDDRSHSPTLYSFYQGKDNLMVQEITDGLGFNIAFDYKPMTDNSVYEKGTSSVYPLFDIETTRYMVSSTSVDNGIGGKHVFSYSYDDAIAHIRGKGYLGMRKFRVTDNSTGIFVSYDHGLDLTYFIFQPTFTITANGIVVISRISYDSRIKDFGDNRIFPYIRSKKTTSYLSGAVIYEGKYYNESDIQYGNITAKTEWFGNNDDKITRDYEYETNGAWCPSKVNKVTETKHLVNALNKPDYIRVIEYTYEDGLVKTQVTDPGKFKAVTTTYTYNDVGNPLNITVSASGLTSRSSSYTYDLKFRLPESTTNVLGHSSSVTYDFRFGVTTSETDPNALTTNYYYDEFGRLEKTISPTGQVFHNDLIWADISFPENAVYSIKTYSPTDGFSNAAEYYDKLGRVVQVAADGFDGKTVFMDNKYNSKGYLIKTSEPYFDGETKMWTTSTYDEYNRISSVTTPTTTIDYSYSGLTETVTQLNRPPITKTYDAAGRLVGITDAGGDIEYIYHPSGQVGQTTAIDDTTTIEYDEFGMKSIMNDPDAGQYLYSFNAFGELMEERNPNHQTTTFEYDVLGRLDSKVSPDQSVDYTYDEAENGIGLLSGISSDVNINYTYDDYSRISSYTEEIDNSTFTYSYNYNDETNSLEKMTYPSGFSVLYEYDIRGNLKKLKRGDNQELIWECEDVNSRGQMLQALLGNGLNINNGFDQYGFINYIQTTNVQDMEYNFNHATGNLNWRKDVLRGNITENFAYDDLDRLTNISFNSNSYDVAYSPDGNIMEKTDVGKYLYEGTRPHAVTEISLDDNYDPQNNQSIQYTSFNKTKLIQEGNKELLIIYGPDMARRKSELEIDGTITRTRYYLGAYEKEIDNGNIREINYINGGYGLAAIYIQEGGAGTMYYVSCNYQGNIMLLTKQDGTVAEEYSYDAWGRRRNPNNWADYNITVSGLIYRGYTGHEHLDEFGLINMNGRMYDPVVGSFLSPDIVVQSPGNTQSYNRYAYCLNNPLKYIDPTGYMLAYIYWMNGEGEGDKDFDNEEPVNETSVEIDEVECTASYPEGYIYWEYEDPWDGNPYGETNYDVGSVQYRIYWENWRKEQQEFHDHQREYKIALAKRRKAHMERINKLEPSILNTKMSKAGESEWTKIGDTEYSILMENNKFKTFNNVNEAIEELTKVMSGPEVGPLVTLLEEFVPALKGTGYFFTGVSFTNDSYQFFIEQSISPERYTYRVLATTAAVILTIAGSELAVMVGPSAYMYEKGWDHFKYRVKEMNNYVRSICIPPGN